MKPDTKNTAMQDPAQTPAASFLYTPEPLSAPAFALKDPGSALTHFAGFLFALFATLPLLRHAAGLQATGKDKLSLLVFMISMMVLYGASTAYHSFNGSRKKTLALKRFDHLSIFILIAGSYTPVCTIILAPPSGLRLLLLVWGFALAGMIFKLFWVTCPKWVSSVLYIAMGWLCILALPELILVLPKDGFLLLLAGGLFYTVGGVIYALRFQVFGGRFRYFGSHELFHVFVMIGTAFHYAFMYRCVPLFF